MMKLYNTILENIHACFCQILKKAYNITKLLKRNNHKRSNEMVSSLDRAYRVTSPWELMKRSFFVFSSHILNSIDLDMFV